MRRKKKDEEDDKVMFRPTAAMQLYAMKLIEMGFDSTQEEVAKAIGISSHQVSNWRRFKEFEPWLEEQKCMRLKPILTQLEIVALLNIDNFKYWEALAKRYGYIRDENAPPPLKEVDELTPEQIEFKDQYLKYLESRK